MGSIKTALGAGACALALLCSTVQASAEQGGRATAPTQSLTFTEGTNFSVSPAPGFKDVVIDFHGVLWIMPASGGKARAITDWKLEATRPVWSPRGDLIAFQAFSSGTYQIWTVHPDGSGLTQLTTGLSDNREPAWSPDGSKIAFASDRANEGSYDIWTLDIKSKALDRSTSAPTEESEPAWSPDGKLIAFADGGHMVSTVDAKGMRATPVPTSPGTLSAPAWRTDGSLTYLYAPPPGEAPGLSIRTAGGEALSDKEDIFPFRPHFLPGGSMLYTADGGIRLRQGSATKAIPFAIDEIVNRPSWTPKAHAFSDASAKPVYGIMRPMPSPDGKTILVNALADLYLVAPDGKTKQLTNDGHWEANSRWSADGRAIFYISTKTGTPTLYRQSIDGGKPVPFGLARAGLTAATPSPDESRIAVIDEAGVHIVDRASGADKLIHTAPNRMAFGDQIEWSPDGRMLVLSERKQFNGRYREGVNLVRLIDTQSGTMQLLPPAPDRSIADRAGGVGPVWSPDGKYLAFVMEARIFLMPVGTDGMPSGPATPLTQEAADFPAWSPDSRSITFVARGKIQSIDIASQQITSHALALTYTPAITKGETLIHAGRFWDGKADGYRTDVDLLVRNDRIVSVTPHSTKRRSGVIYVDASQRVVMPGLTDMHVHPDWSDVRPWRAYLALGITTIASMGNGLNEIIERREAVATGHLVSPRLFATGELLDGTRINYTYDRPVFTDEQLELELARIKDANVDFVKTYVRLPSARMLRAVGTAHELGVASGSHFMWPGMETGQTLTSHLTATTRLGYSATLSPGGISYADVIASYSRSGLGLTHTAFDRTEVSRDPAILSDPRIRALLTPGFGKSLEELAARKITPVMEADAVRTSSNVKAIYEAGGIVALGTDAPLTVPALGLQMDMRLLARSGVAPIQVLRMATSSGPRLMGTDKDLGTLEPGKLADLIILDGDPMVDIAALFKVEKVMVGGHLYDQAMLQSGLIEAAAP